MNKSFPEMLHTVQYKFFSAIKTGLLTVPFLLSLALTGQAQNTVSPYSVFGPGEIQNRGFGTNQGMAGAGIALKSGNYINNLNPASYTGMDSLRIISEFGVAGKAYGMTTRQSSQNGFTGNLSHIGLGFKYTRWLAGSFGVVPFSTVNYTISKLNYMEGLNAPYYSTYQGSGGISQFYFGNAIRLGKHLSLGMNVSYMFGSLVQEENIIATTFVPQRQINRYDYLHSLYFDYGMQFSFKIHQTQYSLGATFAPGQDLRSKHVISVYDESFSQVDYQSYNADYLTVPDIIGVGIGIEGNGPSRYKLALDYTYQNWSEAEYPMQSDEFADLHKVVFGMEFHPWRYSAVNASYKNWSYRIGANYTRSYLKFGNLGISDKSITAGVGIPLPGRISNMNVSLTGGMNGTTTNNLVKEKYLIINIGFSLNEIAFMRRKID